MIKAKLRNWYGFFGGGCCCCCCCGWAQPLVNVVQLAWAVIYLSIDQMSTRYSYRHKVKSITSSWDVNNYIVSLSIISFGARHFTTPYLWLPKPYAAGTDVRTHAKLLTFKRQWIFMFFSHCYCDWRGWIVITISSRNSFLLFCLLKWFGIASPCIESIATEM